MAAEAVVAVAVVAVMAVAVVVTVDLGVDSEYACYFRKKEGGRGCLRGTAVAQCGAEESGLTLDPAGGERPLSSSG